MSCVMNSNISKLWLYDSLPFLCPALAYNDHTCLQYAWNWLHDPVSSGTKPAAIIKVSLCTIS